MPQPYGAGNGKMSFPQLLWLQMGISACAMWQISMHTLWGRVFSVAIQSGKMEKVDRKEKCEDQLMYIMFSFTESATSASLKVLVCDLSYPSSQTSTSPKWQLPTVYQCFGINGLTPWPRGYCSIITGHSPSGPLWCPRRQPPPRGTSQNALRGLPLFEIRFV